MATIHVDGEEYEVNGSENLLQACLSLGLDIPYFCWHPALGSAGACRQCAVKQYKDADDKRGRIVMSCMTPASEGTYISIEDEEAKKFRQNIIEFLMTNHPHDCPVCAEGGNCHLQDMTVMTGHSFRRYRFSKRTHNNQDLGPFIAHQMNRCIACYRCVRYYKDYADGTDFGVFGAHNNVYFGRMAPGTLENEFSGNLVEVCPTGVFTDKTHAQRYNRKWDMQFSPSICQECSVGCNISPGERYGELRRIENRYNGEVNRYFLCDRGRFGYGYVNRKDRPVTPLKRSGGVETKLDADQAVQEAGAILRQSGGKVIGIGSARASVESNYALRALVGAENFYAGISKEALDHLHLMLEILEKSGVYTPSLFEIESYDAVFILGEDVTQTAARIALAVRQAIKAKDREVAGTKKVEEWRAVSVQNVGNGAKYPLFISSYEKTRLDDLACWRYCAPAEDQARLGFAVAHALDHDAPAVDDLDGKLKPEVEKIAEALKAAKKPLIISGTGAASADILRAAANIAKALKSQGLEAGIVLTGAEVNSTGLAMMSEKALEEGLDRLQSGTADGVVVLENDLFAHAPAQRVAQALEKAKFLMALDHQKTALTDSADFLFPAASFAEGDGTVISQEGRAQRFFQVYDPAYYDKEKKIDNSWRWLFALRAAAQGEKAAWPRLDRVLEEIGAEIPAFKDIQKVAPDSSFRIEGQKLAREPNRYSGRTAIRAGADVNEPRQPQDKDTMFAFSMEGNNQPTARRSEIPFAWAPGWNSPQAWNKFQDEVGGKLRYGDPGLRLFNNTAPQLDYFRSVPKAFSAESGHFRLVPLYSLFGSAEMAQRSEVFQKRIANPELSLNAKDAADLGLEAGQALSFICGGQKISLPVAVSQTLAAGQIGLPVGQAETSRWMCGFSVHDVKVTRS